LQEKHTDWFTFVAQYRDGSFDRFAVDPFTLLRGNHTAFDDARARQEEGSLKLGECLGVPRPPSCGFVRTFHSTLDTGGRRWRS
jgi:hypothetical protein